MCIIRNKQQRKFQFTHALNQVRRLRYLRMGFILLAVLLLLEAEPPWAAAPFPEGLLEFISADF